VFGALGGVFPFRLGGTPENGVTAAQHARYCADLVAVGRVAPLGSWRFTKSSGSVTITSYSGRNGVGPAHAPSVGLVTHNSVEHMLFTWPGAKFPDPLDSTRLLPVVPRMAIAVAERTGSDSRCCNALPLFAGVAVSIIDLSGGGAEVDGSGYVTVWGTVGDQPDIGLYGGDLDKEDSKSEGTAPYAEAILRQFQRDRGTAYTDQPGTLVDVENVALARFWAAVGPRTAERLRANATPKRSDERLPYWQQVLGVASKPGERKWQTRRKCAVAYRGSQGATNDEVRTALTELLGDVFVDISWSQGADLATPPTQTYWPGINPGDSSLSLGGGAWTSERCHLNVTVQAIPGMPLGEFLTLVEVDMFRLLDSLLPAWATFSWINTATATGFFLGVSRLNLTALTDS